MVIHLRIEGLPLCWKGQYKREAFLTNPDIRNVDCAKCLLEAIEILKRKLEN